MGNGVLKLAEAQQIAFERNWDLLAAAVDVDAATAAKIVAHEFPNPSLSLSSSKISVDDHPNSTPAGNTLWDRSYDTVVAVNQLVEIGGKRRNRQASAQAGLEAARGWLLDARRSLELGVAKAYIAALLASENVRILTNSADRLRKEAELAKTRLRAGEISTADKSQIEITADRFELDAQAAASAAKQACITLETLLGVRQPGGNLQLADLLEELGTAPAPPDTQSVMYRPDVLAAEAAMRKADADFRLQRANRIPDPTFLAQYEHEPPDLPNTIGLGLSFPLPLWNRNRGNIRAAEAAREQARIFYDKAYAQAAAEVATARLVYEEASRRWQKYRDVERPKSEQVRKTLSYAYEKGGASLLDMLLAQRNDNEIRWTASWLSAT
jgi:outer membrane protein, heavy metal efflux system